MISALEKDLGLQVDTMCSRMGQRLVIRATYPSMRRLRTRDGSRPSPQHTAHVAFSASVTSNVRDPPIIDKSRKKERGRPRRLRVHSWKNQGFCDIVVGPSKVPNG